jgi:hypothetical protein
MMGRFDHEAHLGAAAVLAGILGFVQFGLFFSDLSGSSTLVPRVVAGSLLGAASGIALGRLRPGEAIRLSLIAVWGAVLWGGMLWIMDTGGWLAVLAVPAGAAMLGGVAGGAWGRRRLGTSRASPPSSPPPGSTS